jgi:hypothetical protein
MVAASLTMLRRRTIGAWLKATFAPLSRLSRSR